MCQGQILRRWCVVIKLTSKGVFLIMETENSAENPSSQCFEIGATVISGLEHFAKEECEEKLKCKTVIGRGRIYFHIAKDQLHSVSKLIKQNILSL